MTDKETEWVINMVRKDEMILKIILITQIFVHHLCL